MLLARIGLEISIDSQWFKGNEDVPSMFLPYCPLMICFKIYVIDVFIQYFEKNGNYNVIK